MSSVGNVISEPDPTMVLMVAGRETGGDDDQRVEWIDDAGSLWTTGAGWYRDGTRAPPPDDLTAL